MLQSEAGYIDARPLTTISTKTLATHGRTIHSGQKRAAKLQFVMSGPAESRHFQRVKSPRAT